VALPTHITFLTTLLTIFAAPSLPLLGRGEERPPHYIRNECSIARLSSERITQMQYFFKGSVELEEGPGLSRIKDAPARSVYLQVGGPKLSGVFT
jgi:hypothetical protein